MADTIYFIDLTAGTPLTLCPGKGTGNIALAVTKAGTYQFTLKVIDKNSPTLTLTIKSNNNCKLLADSTDTAPMGATKLALRGAHVPGVKPYCGSEGTILLLL